MLFVSGIIYNYFFCSANNYSREPSSEKAKHIHAESIHLMDFRANHHFYISNINSYSYVEITNEVTRIVTESAQGIQQISENIQQVLQAAASTGKDAVSAQSAAKGVGDISVLLKKYVDRLKVQS
jgi:methyl-accepting chemotaxis protein